VTKRRTLRNEVPDRHVIHEVQPSITRVLASTFKPTVRHSICDILFNQLLIFQVLEISPDVDTDPTPNRTSIYMEGIYEAIAKNFNYDDFASYSIFHVVDVFCKWAEIVCREELRSKGGQELLRLSSSEQFDVIITQTNLNECFYGFISKFGSPPVIGISAHTILPRTSNFMGTPVNPSYMPFYHLPYSDSMNFIQRLHNFIIVNYATYVHEYHIVPNLEAMAKRYFKEELESYWNLERNFSILLANTAFGLDYPRPVSPNVIPVGGMHIKRISDPLPKDLQHILDEAKDGFIFLSLGTNLKFGRLQILKAAALFEAFASLPQRILLKSSSSELAGIPVPPNVIVRDWFSQNAVLAHPNIRVFITHCGRLSMMEAIYRMVPIVGIPFFIDQHFNMKLMLERGVAVHVDYNTLSKESVLSAVREVLSNHSYRENVKKLSAVFRDQADSALERAVFWTEYVIKHKGAQHLRPASVDLHWYQYLLLDVMLVLLIVVVLLILILYYALSTLYTFAKSTMKHRKTD
ncbi:hypothetical protein ANN_24477, partial [Periplaneta americana]